MKRMFSIPHISPVIRISIGLLLLTMSLLLVGDLLGVVPNQQDSEVNSRKIMAESLAIQVSSEIGENRIKQVVNMLNVIVKRNDSIQSIALRTATNKLIMKSDNHELYWQSREDDSSTADYIQVPIYGQYGRWGTLEVSFVPIGSVWTNMFSSRSFSAMLLFIFIFGFIAYWLFLRKALSELDPSSVVPDRVRSALDVLNEGLVIVDINERIVLINEALKKKLALSESELMGKRLSNLDWAMEDETKLLDKQMLPWNMLLDTEQIPTLKTLQLKTSKDETFAFDINVAPIKAPNQKIKGVIVTIDDVTELEKKNNELNHILERLEKSKEEISRQNFELMELSTRDPLTDLLNRRALFQGLNTLLAEAQEQSYILSCMMLDIDFFKSVNDTYGHAIGDKVIQTFSGILQSYAQQDYLTCRYGGEEFIIILPNIDINRAIEIAEKIRIAISEYSFEIIAEGLHVTSSFGVTSTQGQENIGADKLVDQADQALYIAKQSGRNQVVQYKAENIEDPIEIKPRRITETQRVSSHSRKLEESKNPEESSLKICEDSVYTIILDRLTQAQKLAQRTKKHLAVLSISIDTIQLINNTLGHSTATKLKKVAFERLSDTFRISDSIVPRVEFDKNIGLSRLSDSEFIAILSGIEEDTDITWAIFRMINELELPVEIDGHEIVMTANIGISSYKTDGEDADTLLTNSRMALVKAREKGRGEFIFYNKEMNIIAKKALQIESQLHLSLEREELYLNFQPIIDLKTGLIEKVEVLLRWKHPELGLVPPDIFVDIAEHTGRIKLIGKWIIEKACRQLYLWQKNGHPDLMISINLSAVQFYQKEIVQDIVEIVNKENISPHSIVFELTETALLKEYEYISESIRELHEKGFNIALDDFGTGYSSLTYLQKFPINLVKIDHSLMRDFPNDIHTVSIVSGLIGLCHNIGIEVVCEGIENHTQLSMLDDLRCDAVQGFLISKPLSSIKMTEFLDTSIARQIIHKSSVEKKLHKDAQNNTILVDVLNTPHSLS